MQNPQNCPDFDFVEFSLYEASEWAEKYESEDELVVIDARGSRVVLDVIAEGDEALNHVFFHFLHDLLSDPATLNAIASVHPLPERLGVQMLDSAHETAWTPRQCKTV